MAAVARAFRPGRVRHQMPVYSPVPLASVLRGLVGQRAHHASRLRSLADELRAAYRAEDVRLCGSGTQALQLAIETATQHAGDMAAVALPAFCCYDLATAAVGASAPIALYDLDPDTLGPHAASLERVLRGGARVVVVAHLYGVPVDWDAVGELAARYGAVVIEDAAQGHGGAWRDQPLGSLGDLSVLSFGRGKGWTGGGGGALLTRGGMRDAGPDLPAPPLSAEVRLLAATLAQWALARPSLYRLPLAIPGLGLGETLYHEPCAPQSVARAALPLLSGTRTAANTEAEQRRAHGAALLHGLKTAPAVRPISPHADASPGYLRLPVRLPQGMASFPSASQARRLGVAPSYPSTLAALPAVASRLTGPERTWPGAERLVQELVTFPTHSRLTATERRALVDGAHACDGGKLSPTVAPQLAAK